MSTNAQVDQAYTAIETYVNANIAAPERAALLTAVDAALLPLRPPAIVPTTSAEQAATTNAATEAAQPFYRPDGSLVSGWTSAAALLGLTKDQTTLAFAKAGAVTGPSGETLTMFRPERQTSQGRILRQLEEEV